MFKQEAYDLMGAAFEVYNELGYGMAEKIYQAALEVELRIASDSACTAQASAGRVFQGTVCSHQNIDRTYLLFDGIVVELKATEGTLC